MIAVGIAVQGPLSSVPENTLKFGVGVLLSGFGTFCVGEDVGFDWPGADLSIVWLCLGFLAVASAAVPLPGERRTGRARPSRSLMERRSRLSRVRTAARELFGLFVDDYDTAVAVLICIALAWLALPRLPALGPFAGALLFAGLAGILIASALRRAGR